MKSSSSRSTPPRGNILWPIVIAVCAAGAGITGTLLVVQNQAPTAATTSSSQSGLQPLQNPAEPLQSSAEALPSATEVSASSSPPAELTTGMSPAQASVALGNWHFDHKEWAPAIAHYKQAIALGTDNPDVRTDLGSSYRFAGQPKQALEQYARAQKQNPQHENSLFNQGGLLAFDLKQPDKGIVIWQRYLQRFPQGGNVKAARQFIEEAKAHKNHSSP